LEELDTLVGRQEINCLVIVPEESLGKVTTFAKRGSYKVRIVADPDGTLVAPFALYTSPTHIFINRKGMIQSVKRGLVTRAELLDTSIN
jgi:hypothetical protein